MAQQQYFPTTQELPTKFNKYRRLQEKVGPQIQQQNTPLDDLAHESWQSSSVKQEWKEEAEEDDLPLNLTLRRKTESPESQLKSASRNPNSSLSRSAVNHHNIYQGK